ncbi:hypothetical protein NOMA109596_18875 [Nocardioides marinus]
MSPASAPLPSTSSIAETVLSSRIAGPATIAVEVESVSLTVPPPGLVPVAVAVFSILPASTSPWDRV